MYGDVDVDRTRLLSEVLNAADGYVDGLSDRAVRARLETLLAADPGRIATADDLIAVASDLVRVAQQAGRERGLVSFYGDLADRALFSAVARSATEEGVVATPSAAVATFARELLGFAVDHLVSRDLTAHLGEGSIPSATAMLSLRSDLVSEARRLVDIPQVRDRAAAVAETQGASWRGLVSAAWSAGRELRGVE